MADGSYQPRQQQIIVPRVWRSQAPRVLLFLIISPIAVWLSQRFPGSVIHGTLFSLGESFLTLHLPLFWFIPAFVIGQAIMKIYDVRYTIDSKGIESKIGILSLSQTITRIRYEDIRSIDTRQSLTERLLGIGALEMGTAASAGLEMSFTGIADPLAVQGLLQAERDARLRKAAQRTTGSSAREYGNAAAAGGE